MTGARQTFLTNVSSLRTAVDERLIWQPLDIGVTEDVSKLFRNGLAVAGFAILENFIRARCEEYAEHINRGPASYGDLPDRLQRAAVDRVVAVLNARMRQRASRPEVLDLVVEAADALRTARSGRIQMSRLAFGWLGSNLGADDVAGILRTMGIKDGWREMTRFLRRVHPVTTDPLRELADDHALKNSFVAAQAMRHKAAHDAGYEAAVLALRTLPRAILRVAAAFDALASRGARLAQEADAAYMADGVAVTEAHVPIRFLEERGGHWAESGEGARRAAKRYPDLAGALPVVWARADEHQHVVVVKDLDGDLIDWYCGDVP